MKSAKTILIIAALIFAGLSLSVHSAEQDDATPARVTQPAPVLEEEAPAPMPVTRPVRVTTARTPARTTPTRPSTVTRATPRRRPARPAEDPHKETMVLLEAFMVEVRLSGLHSLGVPVISEGADCVKAEHIIKLMKTTDAAKVTAGAKLALAHENKARSESITRKAIYKDPPNNANIEYVNVGTSFTAIAEIRKEKVFVELEFEYSDIVKGDKSDNGMPQILERNWTSTVCLKPGEPTITGATQDRDLATFLIVTANIKE